MRLLRRLPTPGTAPGALPVPDAIKVPTRLTMITYGADTYQQFVADSPDELPDPPTDQFWWLDIEGHDVATIATVAERLALHPLLVEDVVNVGQRPKVEAYGETLFFVVEHFVLEGDDEPLQRDQVSLVVMPTGVLSVRERRDPLFDPVRRRLEGGRPRIRGGGPGYLAYALIDVLVDHLFAILQRIGDSIEDIEEPMLTEPSQEQLNTAYRIKRNVLMLRKSAWPLRDMISTTIRDEDGIFSDETRLYLRDAADHASHAIDIIETYREMLSSLTDLYMSSVSNRMNEVMKVLTIIATIFIPLSFIAGLYGMNFDPEVSPLNMPELGWYWGYPAALLVMLGVAAGLLAYFRRKGWL